MNENETIDRPIQSSFDLSDAALERLASLYPTEMREDFLWLGSFTRTACGRDLDVLAERARKLGFDHDKTTYSKILRGKWNRDAAGNELPVPVMAIPKFKRLVDVLRKDDRVRDLAGQVPFIETPTSRLIWDYIDAKRAQGRVNRMGVIIGHTGTQKSATLEEYCRRNNHGLCAMVEAPATGQLRDFYVSLGLRYGVGVSESTERIKRKLLANINSRKTIIVENVQRLHRERDGGDQRVFSYLQSVHDETKCTIILTVSPTYAGFLTDGMNRGFFEQFEGRAGGRRNFLRLPEYPTQEDVIAIAQGFGLRDAEKHADYLAKIAREPGRVRRVFEDLQEAKCEAEAEKKPLTIAHVRAIREED